MNEQRVSQRSSQFQLSSLLSLLLRQCSADRG